MQRDVCPEHDLVGPTPSKFGEKECSDLVTSGSTDSVIAVAFRLFGLYDLAFELLEQGRPDPESNAMVSLRIEDCDDAAEYHLTLVRGQQSALNLC